MSFDNVEPHTKHCFVEHVLHLPDESNHVLVGVDITGTLEDAFLAADQYLCPFCEGPLIHHRLKTATRLLRPSAKEWRLAKDGWTLDGIQVLRMCGLLRHVRLRRLCP